jgi:hypothetical protein
MILGSLFTKTCNHDHLSLVVPRRFLELAGAVDALALAGSYGTVVCWEEFVDL